jgi:hypothetical protein
MERTKFHTAEEAMAITLEEKVALLAQEVERLRIDLEAYGCIAKALVTSPMAATSARKQAQKIFVGDHRGSIAKQLDGILDQLGFPLAN